MSTYEYWIGQDIDFRSVWDDFESGFAYIDKYRTMDVHLMRLTFEQYPTNLPLFNHEAIFKTVKGYFHELKRTCMTKDEYVMAGPLFIYGIDRGSATWSFLGELRQLLLFGTTLADERIVGQKLDNIDKKLAIINRHFGGAYNPEDFQRFMRAKTSPDLEFAVRKLLHQKLRRIEISRESFIGEMDQKQRNLIELKSLLEGKDGTSQ